MSTSTKALPATTRDEALQSQLDQAYALKGAQYVPRTHHITDGQAHYVNRLIHEASPYLLQHAHNPVDWWPWGEAALAEAARRDVPVFLSAGYATCHWCHVMEEESFDDLAVAEALNRNFVAVKLDREQRPDIDQLYILATTLQNRHAGWPNSVWMFPDGRPFHTGTYFPKAQFLPLLGAIAGGWHSRRPEFSDVADKMKTALGSISGGTQAKADLASAPDLALSQLAQNFNDVEGGFSTGTQFPQEVYHLFLADSLRRGGPDLAAHMLHNSVDAMVAGGIHDQIGGGFHRYTVDVNWRTPHFEKMLYNQALMLRVLSESYDLRPSALVARACDRLVAYLMRDMTCPDGAFYAAEDADSLDENGQLEEGAFYAWTRCPAGAKPLGLHLSPTLEAGAVPHLEVGAQPDIAQLNRLCDRLFAQRDTRPRPLRDEKIILGWNALAIRALAEASALLDRPNWRDIAKNALKALLAMLRHEDGMGRIAIDGQVLERPNLFDIANLGLAHFALGEINEASALADRMISDFAQPNGRFALMRDGTPLGPIFETDDGAMASGESAALELLALLHHAAPSLPRRQAGQALLDALSGRLAEMPVARLEALRAARIWHDGPSGKTRILCEGRLTVEVEPDAVTLIPNDGWHIDKGGLIVDDQPWPHAVKAQITIPREPRMKISVTLCSDTVCLAPQDILIT